MHLIRRHSFFLILLIMGFVLSACSHGNNPKLKRLPAESVILALGDSLTYGAGATSETSYPAYLQKILHMQVINAGVSGEETMGTLQRVQQLLEQYQPRLVILCIGGNDIMRKRSKESIKKNLSGIVHQIKSSGAQVVMIGVPDFNFLLSPDELYQEVAKEFNVPVNNDILPALLRQSKYKSDYIHLNAKGYQLLAEKIAEWLKELGAIA